MSLNAVEIPVFKSFKGRLAKGTLSPPHVSSVGLLSASGTLGPWHQSGKHLPSFLPSSFPPSFLSSLPPWEEERQDFGPLSVIG